MALSQTFDQIVAVYARQPTTWRLRCVCTSFDVTASDQLTAIFVVRFGVGSAYENLRVVVPCNPLGVRGLTPDLPAQGSVDLILPAASIQVNGMAVFNSDAVGPIVVRYRVAAFAAPIFAVPEFHGP